MTIEKTTEILQELWRYKKTDKYTESEIRLALDIAIQTLKKRPRFMFVFSFAVKPYAQERHNV